MPMPIPAECLECYYLKRYGGYCDYFSMVGHLKGPKVDGVCPVRKPVNPDELPPKKRFNNQALFPTKVTAQRQQKYAMIVKMAEKGHDDREIAAAIGYAVKTVRKIRLSFGLVYHRREYKVTDRATGEVICQGPMGECVRATGVSESTISANARGQRQHKKFIIELTKEGGLSE